MGCRKSHAHSGLGQVDLGGQSSLSSCVDSAALSLQLNTALEIGCDGLRPLGSVVLAAGRMAHPNKLAKLSTGLPPGGPLLYRMWVALLPEFGSRTVSVEKVG